MAILEARGLKKYYGQGDNLVKAVDDISLSVAQGEFVAIVGTSGSGKTTLLNLLGGLDNATSGEIIIDGQEITGMRDEALTVFRRRKIGFVFQHYNLVSMLDVRRNITLPIRLDGNQVDQLFLDEVVEQLGIAGKLSQKPNQLSGGQQQRVALARILCSQPEVILLDEPFSALDSYLKWDLELKLSDFLENFSGPILWVSHDRGEVFRNCKRVCVLDQGASQGTFTLRQLFHEPETEAAARLSGCKNIVEAVPAGSAVTLPAWGLTLNCGKPVPADIRQAGIRARHVMTVPEGTPDAFYCTVERVIQDVFTTIVLLRPEGAADGAPLLRMELERDDWRRLNRPEGLWIAVQPRDILLLK